MATDGGGALARMNNELWHLYRLHWKALNRIRLSENDISWPLLIKVPPEYDCARRRLVIVGQQTYGWDHSNSVRRDPVRSIKRVTLPLL